VRDVILVRSKLPGAGAGSKLLMDVGPESMAKWADSPPMLDESPTEIGVAGKWVRDVILVRSKGAGASGLESMAKWVDSLSMLDESPTEIGVAGEWVRDVVWVRSKLRGAGTRSKLRGAGADSKLKGAGADSEMLMDMGPETMAKGDASGV